MVAESECDIVGKLIILKQELELRTRDGRVNIVGRLPSENVLGSFIQIY